MASVARGHTIEGAWTPAFLIMENLTISELCSRYRIESASLLFGNILNQIHQGQPLSSAYLKVLVTKGHRELYRHATGEITFEGYIAALDAEEAKRVARIEAAREAEVARLAQLAKAQLKRAEAEEAARVARENDPAYIEQKQRESLLLKYDIRPVTPPSIEVIRILEQLEADVALDAETYLWLTTAGERYFTVPVRRAYHRGHALRCAAEFKRSSDPWSAVNASGHYRKCDMASDALELLEHVDMARLIHPKIKSALLTTRGGVKRDLGQQHEAASLGEQAHALTPMDFRPCTLLGAVHMELGNFGIANDWYAKALERGATERSIDSELKSIFAKATTSKRDSLRAFLLNQDPVRFAWANVRVSKFVS